MEYAECPRSVHSQNKVLNKYQLLHILRQFPELSQAFTFLLSEEGTMTIATSQGCYEDQMR